MVIIPSFTNLQSTILDESASFHHKIIASDCSGDCRKSYLRSIQEYKFKIRKKIETKKKETTEVKTNRRRLFSL